MSLNCCRDEKRVSPDTVAVKVWPLTEGSDPREPVANWAFCAVMAFNTWLADSPYPCSLSESSQMRMAYSEPSRKVLPIPLMRATTGWIWEARMSLRRPALIDGLLDDRAMNSRMSGLAFATTTPCWVTWLGNSGCARATLFCTCTSAMSWLVPVAKLRVIVAVPLLLDVEVKYNRLSMPVSCCSMTCVTVDSMVAALAPG